MRHLISTQVGAPFSPTLVVAILPSPEDNCAIATQRVDEGATILYNGQPMTMSHTLLEGHRFCISTIKEGLPLTSWGEPFGWATRDIFIGEYVINKAVFESLQFRDLGFKLPEPNFEDRVYPRSLENFTPGTPLPRSPPSSTFQGFKVL